MAPVAAVGAPSAPSSTAAPLAPDRATAAQLYKSAVGLIGQRAFERAAAELTHALELDPELAVAWAARGSARYGLGQIKEASQDYQGAIERDGRLATPVWGLAECYRLLGDDRAAETYARYAAMNGSDSRDDLRDLARKRARELAR